MVDRASRVPCEDERRTGGGGGGTATSGRLPLPPQRFLLPLLLLALALLTPPASGIKCYECVHNNQRMKRHNRYVYPCSEFDGSDRYIMNCPDSKLCIYQRITLPLSNAENIIVRTMDGCTPNTTDNARYAEAGLVKEGCIQHKSVYKPPSSEYCYCSHNLCNSTTLNFPSTVVLAILLATVLFNNHQWPRS